MLCPNCKKEIPDGVSNCPECGAAVNAPAKKQKKPITKKWWFWVIIAVVVIAVISSVSSGSDEPTSSDSETTTLSADSETTAKADETTTASDSNYHVGDVLNVGDVAITYVSAEKWDGYEQYAAPAAGNMIVRIELSAVNNGSDDYSITSYDFNCYADNQAMSEYWSGDGWISATLSSGRSTSGYVYFEVPEDAESIEIEYETNIWTSEKAIFVVEL